jgi:hypothetical protein
LSRCACHCLGAATQSPRPRGAGGGLLRGVGCAGAGAAAGLPGPPAQPPPAREVVGARATAPVLQVPPSSDDVDSAHNRELWPNFHHRLHTHTLPVVSVRARLGAQIPFATVMWGLWQLYRPRAITATISQHSGLSEIYLRVEIDTDGPDSTGASEGTSTSRWFVVLSTMRAPHSE